MIISASRRTDIPAFYSDRFFNRLREGYVCAQNPMNLRQVSKISLDPDVVGGIVFRTKDPTPMMHRLHELKDYAYHFQFTEERRMTYKELLEKTKDIDLKKLNVLLGEPSREIGSVSLYRDGDEWVERNIDERQNTWEIRGTEEEMCETVYMDIETILECMARGFFINSYEEIDMKRYIKFILCEVLTRKNVSNLHYLYLIQVCEIIIYIYSDFSLVHKVFTNS